MAVPFRLLAISSGLSPLFAKCRQNLEVEGLRSEAQAKRVSFTEGHSHFSQQAAKPCRKKILPRKQEVVLFYIRS